MIEKRFRAIKRSYIGLALLMIFWPVALGRPGKAPPVSTEAMLARALENERLFAESLHWFSAKIDQQNKERVRRFLKKL